jgi:hypothetical protein
MSDKNKNRKTRLTDFFRYHRNELSGGERNSFERELQKDPFTEEASEGFHSILRDSAGEDISDLEKRLKSRTSGRKSVLLYRIAASVAVLVAISSIFIIIDKNKSSKQLAVNTLHPPELEIARSKPVTQSEIKTIPSHKQFLNEKRKSESQETKTLNTAAGASEEQSKANPVPDKSENINIVSKSAELQKNDNLSDLKSESSVSEIEEDRISIPAGVVSRDRSLKKVETEKDISGYIPPLPLNGKSAFDRYIKENIHRPDSLTEQSVEVILSFIVQIDGSLDSIKIVSSPGKLFSDEVIHLIKSGPVWKPAELSGKLVEGRVKVKIEFR